MEDEESTPGMMGCYAQGRDRWDAELNRSYTALLNSLKDDQKTKLRDAQRRWLDFLNAQHEAIGFIYYADLGTLGRVRASEQPMNIVKEQALRLMSIRAR